MKKFDFGKKKKKPAQSKLSFPKLSAEEVQAAKEKQKAKPTTTILSFFKKVDQDVLFMSEDTRMMSALFKNETGEHVDEDFSTDRFNESDQPVKRRRISPQLQHPDEADLPKSNVSETQAQPTARSSPARGSSKVGGFVLDSDSDSDASEDAPGTSTPTAKSQAIFSSPMKALIPAETTVLEDLLKKPPSLHAPLPQDDDVSGDLFIDDDVLALAEEEYDTMLAMREQDRREAAEDGIEAPDMDDDFHRRSDDEKPICPICSASMEFASLDEATRHVNSCLDGTPTPLPTAPKSEPASSSPTFKPGSSRAEKAAVPRPGQADPFSSADGKAGSAFFKLMSARVENKAWAQAAKQAVVSKGKPAYTRTCPFYKIMPGFSICVDGFRYGAVQGCNAYFLSHFHSDHYIGLSSKWCHGPIYCSKVTATLMKKQLRVADKWVVSLEWEMPTTVPGTDGVTVTMIPANHCPGSSLFLFEKNIGGRTQRILHCGDFRACPAHVTHPLLRPETLADAVLGTTKQQKIDICYLDTTYLDPRYAFPPQTDVIKACAELCAEISADPDAPCPVWDRLQYGAKKKKSASTISSSQLFSSSTAKPTVPCTTAAPPSNKKLLVICGTYSIGKERVCVAVAHALKTKIFAPARKLAICKMLDDPELAALLTSDPLAAQVHLQSLGDIRPDVIDEYRRTYGARFSRVVALRPSGWTYRPPSTCADGSSAPPANAQPGQVPTTQLLHGAYWRARFGKEDVAAARGGSRTALCLGVPYSEHSSFRELAMFLMSLNIERVVPTVNVGSEASRKKMKAWIDRWTAERRRGGLVEALEGREEEREDVILWDGKGKGGGAWW
ncbi:hypothetical protein TD95_001802 [Thielaviopsis punctulata]|uniref:DNA repair metallo-beta-lactamase domain-containing protein n=1 Tax=Thielaviopsis punctulata TaxID=72032 RepID=A0A0F4ZBK1_9PEZI|nr:hypothetical protein TD95_001802 [Thielaviopsis punctulata]